MDELSQKVKEEKQHSQNLEQELSNANSVIDSLHEQIKHLEHIIITEQERNKQNLVSCKSLIHILTLMTDHIIYVSEKNHYKLMNDKCSFMFT